MIKDFEEKIDTFFSYIPTIDDGIRLIAKINDDGTAFSQDEIYRDFSKIYRKYIILNKDLGDFFKRETKDSLTQLCDDFERTVKNKA
jgi:type I restriction enzyme R subunit